jgi:hypothetical protein
MSTATQTPATNGDSLTTTSARLEEAIRQIVREEIKHPSVAALSEETKKVTEVPASSPQPNLKDGLWLLLIVTNVALLLALVPDNVLTNSKLGLLVKLVPWLGSYLFVLGYAWFRDGILELTRHIIFKVLMLGALVILGPLSVSKLRIFQVHPLIEPSSAEVQVDGEPVAVDTKGEIRISLQRHTITISENSTDEGEKPNTREFQMSFREAFRAWRESTYQPRWTLLYDVAVSDQKAVDELEIRKAGDLDPDFWRNPEPAYGGAAVTQGREPGMLLFKWTGGDVGLRLPYGSYKLTARRQGCLDTEVQSVEVKKGVGPVRFQRNLCP